MKKNNTLLTILCLSFFFLVSCNQSNEVAPEISTDNTADISLEAGFNNPPVSAKPKGLWCFVNGNFDLGQITAELKEYKAKGVGTLDIWDVAGWVDPNNVIPAGPPFMGEKSVQAIAHAIREAGKIDMEIGLVISSSWNAGGSWVEAKDGVMGLYESAIKIKGGDTFNGKLPFPEIAETFAYSETDRVLPAFYKEVAVLAYTFDQDSLVSKMIDISEHFDGENLSWEAPEGDWHVTRYICANTEEPLKRPSPNSHGLMIDHFNPEATKRHLNFFFEKLEAELGDISKTALKYLYTDSYEANSAVWTTKMPEEFKKRRGYDLYPYLPALNGFIVDNEEISERFLFDYKQTLSDLIIENHYELGQQMCKEKGIEFIAEAGGPGPPLHNVPFESLSSLGALGSPRGEFWFDTMWSKEKIDGLQIIKAPASASHLYNQPRVEAEAFTGTQIWQFGPGDLKSTADRAMCEGLTSFVYHTSPHIPREAGTPGWVYNFGTIINTTRAWWPKSAGFHHYIGRSCFMLQQGNFIGDVLYYYGDKAPNFVAPKNIDPALGFGYDYDVCNSDIILNYLDIKDGYFVLPHGQKYKVLVLPDDIQMNPAVLEKLAELVKKGGTLIGKKPTRSHSMTDFEKNDARIVTAATEMWASAGKTALGKGFVFADPSKLRAILSQDLGVQPDILVNNEAAVGKIDFIHRQTATEDIYFFRNTTAQKQVYDLSLRSTKGSPELWNPDNTERFEIPVFIQADGVTRLPLVLEPYGSTFIVFQGKKNSNPIVGITQDGISLFPMEGKAFPISFTPSGITFEVAGKYQMTFKDGTTKNHAIAPASQQTIAGAWEIRFPHGWGAPRSTTFDELISWTVAKDKNIQHFSGVGVYHKTFEIENIEEGQQLILDLGSVSKVAEVYLNGQNLGIKWFAPYSFDISKAVKNGKNHLVVEVANVMTNQMTGDASREGADKRTHSNITKGPNAWMYPYKELRLIESGLMGPVNIYSFQTTK